MSLSKKFVCRTILSAAMVLFVLSGAVATAETTLYKGAPAKYVFLFIGDGMGIPQKTAAELFTGETLEMNKFPAQGLTTTFAADRFITGSAASATALAAGQKTNIGMLGMAPDQQKVKSIADMAQEKGWKVGVISSVSLDHATPAAFYAKVPSRNLYHEIDHQLVESGFDFFAGGGLKDPVGKRVKKKDPNAKTLGDAIEKAKSAGYKIVTKKADFMALKPGDGKILAWNEWLQDSDALPYTMDQRKDKDVSLPEFTAKAIEMLDNDKGFFLMVEGGKIDWACHANDGAASVINTLDFDKAIQEAARFYDKHPQETLIVVTGDHECGGMTIGFAGTNYGTYFDVLKGQKVSFQKFTDDILKNFKGDFEEAKKLITENFGLKFEGDGKKDRLVLADFEIDQIKTAFDRFKGGEKEKASDPVTALLYGGYNPLSVALTHILNQKAGMGWTSYQHTGVPIATSAKGLGEESFNGYYDNTDVALKIMAVMGIPAQIHMAGQSARKVASN